MITFSTHFYTLILKKINIVFSDYITVSDYITDQEYDLKTTEFKDIDTYIAGSIVADIIKQGNFGSNLYSEISNVD